MSARWLRMNIRLNWKHYLSDRVLGGAFCASRICRSISCRCWRSFSTVCRFVSTMNPVWILAIHGAISRWARTTRAVRVSKAFSMNVWCCRKIFLNDSIQNGPQRYCSSASLHSVVPWCAPLFATRLIPPRSNGDSCCCLWRSLHLIAHGVSSILLKRT